MIHFLPCDWNFIPLVYKHIQGLEESGVDLSIKEDLIWNLFINSRGWTTCSNIGSSGHCISPEGFWKLGLLKHCVCKSGQCLIHSFCQAILLWCIWDRDSMKCPISLELVPESLVDIFDSAITVNPFDIHRISKSPPNPPPARRQFGHPFTIGCKSIVLHFCAS